MQVFAATLALSRHLGMQTCISQDRPGFVVNRMLLPLINEAFFLLMEVAFLGNPLGSWITCLMLLPCSSEKRMAHPAINAQSLT